MCCNYNIDWKIRDIREIINKSCFGFEAQLKIKYENGNVRTKQMQ